MEDQISLMTDDLTKENHDIQHWNRYISSENFSSFSIDLFLFSQQTNSFIRFNSSFDTT